MSVYELTLLTDFSKSWLVFSRPDIIPRLPPTPMPRPNFKSFCTTEWWRCPLFWFTMCEWECECPWSCWCDCLLLCWADFSSCAFIFSCSSRSRRAFIKRERTRKGEKKKKHKFIWTWVQSRYYSPFHRKTIDLNNVSSVCNLPVH